MNSPILSRDSHAELLWEFDRQLAQGGDPAWDMFLGRCIDDGSRAELCADMIRCEASFRGWDVETVRNRLRLYAQYDPSKSGAAAVVRGIYADRLEAGEHPRLSEFEAFDFDFGVLKLQTDEEPVYLGQTIADRYRIEQRIGTGSFGIVYRGTDATQNRAVAVKTVRVTGDEREKIARLLLEQEADLLAKLPVDGIPRLIDFVDTAGGQPVLVREFVDGQTIHQLVQQGPLAPERAAAIVARLADTLQFAHRRGFLHRDLSASNVLIDETDIPFLTDFGLGVGQGELFDQIRHVAGTRRYMSVESRIGATREIDLRDDIYSLGVILYELLTGPCEWASNPRASKARLTPDFLTKLFDPDLDIPPPLRLICQRCVANEPDDRYDTAALFARELRDFLGESMTPVSKEGVQLAQRRLLTWRAGMRYGCAYRLHTYVRLRLERLLTAAAEEAGRSSIALDLMFKSENDMLLQFATCTEFARQLGLTLAKISGTPEFRRVSKDRRTQPDSDTSAWLAGFVDGVDRTLTEALGQLESHLSADGCETTPVLQLGVLCGSLAAAPDFSDTLVDLTAAAKLPPQCTAPFIDAVSANYTDEALAVGLMPEAIDRERDRLNKSAERELTYQLGDALDGHVTFERGGSSCAWSAGSVSTILKSIAGQRILFG